jgi:sugar lactone lactonase YvrE
MRPLETSWFVLLLVLAGCEQPESSPRDPEGSQPTRSEPALDLPPARSQELPRDQPEPECDERPVASFVRFHDYIQSSEDFTFDLDGYLWGVSTQGPLIRTPLDGELEVMRPDISSWGRGVRFLPDGDLVIAEPDRGALLRLDRDTLSGEVLRDGINSPNGIAIGEDGWVHMTQGGGDVLRVDPETGEADRLVQSDISTDGITFAPDYRRLYWNSEGGQVMTLVLDEFGALAEEPALLTRIDTGLAILDGMTSDECGNLYVVKMNGHLIRVLPDGTQEPLMDLNQHAGGAASFISAANFGSGVGGWERDHLYVMSLDHGLFELEIGIRGKWEPHMP